MSTDNQSLKFSITQVIKWLMPFDRLAYAK